MTTVYLALGSNLGDRHANLRLAVRKLEQLGADVAKASRIYQTQTVGTGGEGDFFNAVVYAETWLSAPDLLRVIHRIEFEMGREMPSEVGAQRSGARPIDIDILLFGNETFSTPELQIPHPRALMRPFVLRPLLEVLDYNGWIRPTEFQIYGD